MSMLRHWIQIFSSLLFVLILISLAQADNNKKEVLPASVMSGFISGTFEAGKLLLSSNDKIVVDFITTSGTKLGDSVEIYQPLDPEKKEGDGVLYRRIGLAIIIEKIDEKKAVCIIDSSSKEIAVGNWVRIVTPR